MDAKQCVGTEPCHAIFPTGDFNAAASKYPQLFPPNHASCKVVQSAVDPELECPTGGCQYVSRNDPCCTWEGLDPENPDSPEIACLGCADFKCDKAVWDEHYRAPCCLGLIDSGSETYSVSSILCDPRWCPLDPTGNCGEVLMLTCSSTYTQPDGSVWPLVSKQNHPCRTWYTGALQQGEGSKVAYVDSMIEGFCDKYPESKACACYLTRNANKGCTAPPCTLPYTSISEGNPVAVGYADGKSNPPIPINVVDRACMNSNCASEYSLKTYSIQKELHNCPQ